MIQLNGAQGGGQILRTALALSLVTGKGFYMVDIRKGRAKPGLYPQHLACVNAAKSMCSNAIVEGAEKGSTELRFVPGKIAPKHATFDIGTAGSVTLLLQSLLPFLVLTNKRINLELIGGTDVPWSIPYDYLEHVIVPHLRKYADLSVELVNRGYNPAGNGKVKVSCKGKYTLESIKEAPSLSLVEQGELIQVKGRSHASSSLQSANVADRQAQAAEMQLKSLGVPVRIMTEYVESACPGSGIALWTQNTLNVSEMDFANPIVLGGDALGEQGKPSEEVGFAAANKLIAAIKSKAGCDEHLADNLVPFVALFGGRIRYEKMTEHLRTNINTVHAFLGDVLSVDETNRIISKKS